MTLRVRCVSSMEKLEFDTRSDQSIEQLKKKIANAIGIKFTNFRLTCEGELCPNKAFLISFPKSKDFRGISFRIEFNQTEDARREVKAHERKLGLPPKGPPEKTLLSMLEDFDREFPTSETNIDRRPSRNGLFFRKKESPEAIKEKNLKKRVNNMDKRLEKAYVDIPNFYLEQSLLYLPTEIRGQPLLAVLDTGTKNSVMTLKCARAFGLVKRIDRKFAGTATGMGQTAVLGKIPHLEVMFGSEQVKIDIFVLRQVAADFVLGLEVLKQLRAQISLSEDALILENGTKISFVKPPYDDI